MSLITRRRLMAALGSLPILASTPTLTAGINPNRSTLEELVDPTNPISPEIPDSTVDPFLMSYNNETAYVGTWHDAEREVMIDTVLRVDPDMMDEILSVGGLGPPADTGFSFRQQASFLLAHRYDYAISGGVHMDLSADVVIDWYRRLPDDEKWLRPDGSLVEHPKEIAGEDFHGRRWQRDSDFDDPEEAIIINASIFSDGSRDYYRRIGEQTAGLGVTQLWIDGFGHGTRNDLDFSAWADAAFRSHLEELPPDRIEALGIIDIESFNLRGYLSENNLTPDETDLPAEDPIFREAALFQHREHKEFYRIYYEDSRLDLHPVIEAAGKRSVGNQFGLQSQYLRTQAFYLSDILDEILIETSPRIPPDDLSDLTVKIGRAAGHFDKNVRSYHAIWREQPEADPFDPAEYYPTLKTFHVAKTYAHGGAHNIHITGGPNERFEDRVNSWMRRDGTISEELHRFIDFIRAHRRFLRDVEEDNDVAVVISLPTNLWHWSPTWGTPRRHRDGVEGSGILLREERVACDVLILDYPEVWEDPDQAQRLAGYELIVLPNVECVSESHLAGIEAALEAGTTVIFTGGLPSRDEYFEPRDDVEDRIAGHENVIIIEPDLEINPRGDAAATLREEVNRRTFGLELEPDFDISLNRFRQHDPDRLIIHLLNYSYDPEGDSVPHHQNITVTIRDLPFSVASAKYYTPDGTMELVESTVEDDGITMTVPSLDIWGFIVCGSTEESLEPSTDISSADDLIQEASANIETARDRDAAELMEMATAKLENARIACELGGYDVAADLAEEASEWAETAYPSPVIGIDQAHDQSTSTDYDWAASAEFREAFSMYEIIEVGEWNKEVFNELDILFVPPALSFNVDEHGFTEDELDLVASFVADGGGLVIEGQNDLAIDMDVLTEMFGFTFVADRLGHPEDRRFIAETTLSSLTWMVPTIDRPATVIEADDDLTVWAALPPDTDVWIKRTDTPRNERHAGDEDASGAPVGVATAYGNGLVIGFGYQLLPNTHFGSNAYVLARNIIDTLAKHGDHTRRGLISVDARLPSPRPVDEPDDDPVGEIIDDDLHDDEPDDDVEGAIPGFGVGAAITGIGAAVYMLKRRFDVEKKHD